MTPSQPNTESIAGNKLLAVTESDTPEDEANAYLFCAAPNMLAALKAISHRGKGRNDVLRSFMEHKGIPWLPTESPLEWMARIAAWATKKAEAK